MILEARAARAHAIMSGLCAATAEDPRLKALFQAWSDGAGSRIEAIAQRRDDWPALYNVAWSLVPASHDYIRDQLLGGSSYGPMLALLLPLQYVTDQVDGWSDPPEEIPAPPLPRALPGRRGETTAEARERLTRTYREQMAALATAERAARGPGRMPRTKIGQLEQWGRWLYDTEVREPRATIHELERALHETRRRKPGHAQAINNCSCKGTVRKALDQAARYLHEWLDGGN